MNHLSSALNRLASLDYVRFPAIPNNTPRVNYVRAPFNSLPDAKINQGLVAMHDDHSDMTDAGIPNWIKELPPREIRWSLKEYVKDISVKQTEPIPGFPETSEQWERLDVGASYNIGPQNEVYQISVANEFERYLNQLNFRLSMPGLRIKWGMRLCAEGASSLNTDRAYATFLGEDGMALAGHFFRISGFDIKNIRKIADLMDSLEKDFPQNRINVWGVVDSVMNEGDFQSEISLGIPKNTSNNHEPQVLLSAPANVMRVFLDKVKDLLFPGWLQ